VTAPPRIVGIDVSLTSTGLAGPDGIRRITSKGHRGDSLADRSARLQYIARVIEPYVYGVDLVVIEQPAYNTPGGSTHDRSGLWWLIVDRIHSLDLPAPVVEVSPTARAKYATGKGNAGKDAVLAAVVRRYGHLADIDGNDVADAFVLRAMGMDAAGHPLVEVPAVNREALAKVAWPETVTR
jgi:crossover junction endodeoxyribonuclease RuvC